MSQFILHRSDVFRGRDGDSPRMRRIGEYALAVPRALLDAARRGWKNRADERLLQALSDHQLRDIGIKREHIPHIVRSGWDI